MPPDGPGAAQSQTVRGSVRIKRAARRQRSDGLGDRLETADDLDEYVDHGGVELAS